MSFVVCGADTSVKVRIRLDGHGTVSVCSADLMQKVKPEEESEQKTDKTEGAAPPAAGEAGDQANAEAQNTGEAAAAQESQSSEPKKDEKDKGKKKKGRVKRVPMEVTQTRIPKPPATAEELAAFRTKEEVGRV